jgi:hypothetical protein
MGKGEYTCKQFPTHPKRHVEMKKGRVGYLTEEETKALNSMLRRFDWKGEYVNILQPGESPETCCLRFLRARNFVVDDAAKMVQDHFEWRTKFRVEEKASKTIDELLGCSFKDDILPYYPQGYGGIDKTGRFVYIKLVGKLKVSSILSSVSVEKFVDYEVTEMEKGKWIHAVQSASVGYHVEEFVSIVDLDGFSISLMSSQVWSFLKAISAELQGNYPEVNGGMYIINAPWAFQMIWKSIKLFLDPGTVAKIKILGSDYKGELSKIMDNDQIPIEYGGTFNSLKEICYTTDRREFAPKKRPDPGVAMMGDFHYIAEIERKGTLKGESIEEYNGSVESEVGSAPEVSEDKQAFSGDESEFSQYEDSDGETSQQHDNAPNENSVNESYENGESTPSPTSNDKAKKWDFVHRVIPGAAGNAFAEQVAEVAKESKEDIAASDPSSALEGMSPVTSSASTPVPAHLDVQKISSIGIGESALSKQSPDYSVVKKIVNERAQEPQPLEKITQQYAVGYERKMRNFEEEEDILRAEDKLLQSLSDLEDDDPVFSSLIGRNGRNELPVLYSPTKHPIEKHKKNEPWEIKEAGQQKFRGCSGGDLDVCIIS